MSTRSSRSSRRGEVEEENQPDETMEDKEMVEAETETAEETTTEVDPAPTEEEEEKEDAKEEQPEEAEKEEEEQPKPEEEEPKPEEQPPEAKEQENGDAPDDKVEDEEQPPKPEGEETVVKEADEVKGEEGDKETKPKRGKKRALPEGIDLSDPPSPPQDPEILKQQALIEHTPRTTELEHALYETYKRKEAQVERLSGEITKLKAFISKRKQTYKRKRKDEGAPTRALSAYNIFVQDRFSRLARENEQALKSSDSDAQLKRVPPASLVASTGNQWKELPAEQKIVYEERAREDRKRYEEQMAKYQPPDKQANRKRNKTGYNMFFSAHVLRLKQSEAGVPSERGSVARLVGNAWKQLTAEEKQYYEREADKMNGMNPVDKEDDEEEGDDKRPAIAEYPPNYAVQHGEMHMHGGMPPPMHGHQHTAQHDPRQHSHYYPPNYPYGQHPAYQGYHEQAAAQGQHRHYQGRSHAAAAHYQYPPAHGHPYDQRGMGM